MAAETSGAVAVGFAGDGPMALVSHGAYAPAQSVGQIDQGHELAQLMITTQVTGFQIEATTFQVLEYLLDGLALAVELAYVHHLHRTEQIEKVAIG